MLTLQRFADNDLERLIAWSDTPEILYLWAGSAIRHPLTRAQWDDYVAVNTNSRNAVLAWRADVDGQPAGHIELVLDKPNDSARINHVFIGPPEMRGRGLGVELIRAVLREGFENLRLHRIDLLVFDDNLPAIRTYERVGMKREGHFRECRKSPAGGYKSILLMAMLREEYRSGWSDSQK